MNFICPVCAGPLVPLEKSCQCPKGHSYDRARSGYVNLLMSQSSVSGHGDDKLMVRARSEFLNKGYYTPLCERLCRILTGFAAEGCTVLDAGCGEGYYTEKFGLSLEEAGTGAKLFAIDISKAALDTAAKRYKNAEYAVASIYKIPMADNSVDIVTNIFAPFSAQEFHRILKAHGIIVSVTGLRRHLMELKELVYDNPYENEVSDTVPDGFSLMGKETIEYSLQLDNADDILRLFTMTPYYYKTGSADQNKLKTAVSLKTTVQFGIYIYRKD